MDGHAPIVTLWTESQSKTFPDVSGVRRMDDMAVRLEHDGGGLKISLAGEGTPARFLRLRWNRRLPEKALFLGDAWERSYGDLQWRHVDGGRFMPWYFFLRADGMIQAFGVKVRAGALAFWSADPAGITLWLDVRCGARGTALAGRTLDVATVVSGTYDDKSFTAASQAFCRLMCGDPLLPDSPVYGSNNWYYAYGRSSHAEILADGRLLADLTAGLPNRPFMVIDNCWHPTDGNGFIGGPWDRGNERFPDMPRLAGELRSAGVRPGIWLRPLQNADPAIPKNWFSRRDPTSFVLDPSIPEALEWIRKDIRRLAEWGFELVKHDFSTYDMFGKWGFEANPLLATGDWSFADQSRTSAEIAIGFFRAVLEAAGDALVLGCNTIGHLGAGLMQLARIGDDTSGIRWERTRKMGVNTLAFRLGQHRTFFDVDADCVGIMGEIDWRHNRCWAKLLAESGTPFFASIKPGVLSESEMGEMREFFRVASRQDSTVEPLGELYDTAPERWLVNGAVTVFDWHEPDGAHTDFI